MTCRGLQIYFELLFYQARTYFVKNDFYNQKCYLFPSKRDSQSFFSILREELVLRMFS